MRTVRKLFTGLFNWKSKKSNIPGDKHIPKKFDGPKSDKKTKKKAENKLVRIRKKALKNENKCYATTKSFNDRNNTFEPMTEKDKNPDAKTYLQLKNRKQLPTNKKGKMISYKEWMDIILDRKLKNETLRAKFLKLFKKPKKAV